jgi:hypothetical protein
MFSPTLGLALGAVIPNRLMVMVAVRYGLPLLLIIGVTRLGQEAIGNVGIPDGTDYVAIALLSIIIVTLLLLLSRSFARPGD